MAYTDRGDLMSRRGYKTGSLFQRCEARYGCPSLVDGPPHPETGKPTKVRPKHKCKARWYGSVEAGFTDDGERRRITVSGKTKGVVQRRLDDKVLEVKSQGPANVKRSITVAAWSSEWLEYLTKEIRPNSLTTDKAALKKIVGAIGKRKLSELAPSDVRAVAKKIKDDGGSGSTAVRYHGTLMRLLKAATQEGYSVPQNVLLGKPPKKSKNDRDAMTPEQCIKMVEYLTRRDDDGQLLIPHASRWILALLQGLRQGEAIGLTRDVVWLDRSAMAVAWQVQSLKYKVTGNPAAGFVMPDEYEARRLAGATHLVRPKSDAGWRMMPMVPWAGMAMTEWFQIQTPNPHGLVWPGRVIEANTSRRGKMHEAQTWPRNKANDRDEWYGHQLQVGIQHPDGRPFKVHEIRHSTASLLLALGIDEPIRVAIMGHNSHASTKAYEHVDLTPMLAALNQVSDVLGLPAVTPPSVVAGEIEGVEGSV